MQKTKKAPKKVVTASKSTMAGRSKDAGIAKAQKPAKKPMPDVQAAKKAPTSVKKTVVVKKAAAPAKKTAAGKKEAPKASTKGAAKESVKKAPTAKAAPKAVVSKDSKKKLAAAKAPASEPKKEAPKGERKYAKKPATKPEIADLDPGDDVLDTDDLDVGGEEIIEVIEDKDLSPKSSAAKGRKNEPEKEPASDEEVFLTDAEGRRYCRVRDCDQAATVDNGYCRYHYLLYWRNIQNRKKILSEGKLERYIEELTARYPDKYLELLRKDLRSEKDFMSAIQELEIDESGNDSEFEDEAQSYLDEVRGMGSEPSNDREEDF